ncbi:MAG TPA: ABC transporter permease [Candidatus Flavonifractor intestinipullorum]|uniref:ABC transporter permease n=1 Tax=Candidatus Flavonifractor intestinipullorum TaxID=2838587 RepID=A0A9D2MBX5_9FIRM|nr:ABC transporter permease [Candidatus Flavonifractor intestinipullorum]
MQHKMTLSAFLRKYGRILLGGGVLAAIILISIAAPLITTYDPNALNPLDQNQFPSSVHFMGTDRFGRDIFSRVLYGARISLLVGVLVAVVSTAGGIVLGLLMGYYKTLDKIVMRVLEGVSAFPEMLLALTLACIFGNGVDKVITALAIVGTPSVARIVRSQVLSIKESEHVESARAMGATDARIMFKYILPLCVSPLIIRFTTTMASAILTEASLSFLGVGVDPNVPTWGGILSVAKDFVITHPYMAIYPGLAIVVTVLSISILGDGLRDLLDPKMK